MATALLDTPRLADFADVPLDSINELVSAPTAELVTRFLEKITEKVRAYEESQSSNLKLKVELENAVRTGDAKSKAIRGSLNKSLEETSKLRQQLQTEGQNLTSL